MNIPFIRDLGNIRRFEEGIGQLASAQGGNANFALLYGPPGLGKTEAAINRSAKDNYPMIRAKRAWSITWMLTELCEVMGLPISGRSQTLYTTLRDHLLANRPTIYVDELDHVISNKNLIETLRDLADETGCKVVLIGMKEARDNIKRYTVLESRISNYIAFTELTELDVATVVAQVFDPQEGEHQKDAIRALTNRCKGNWRRLVSWIEAIDLEMSMGKKKLLTLDMIERVAKAKGDL